MSAPRNDVESGQESANVHYVLHSVPATLFRVKAHLWHLPDQNDEEDVIATNAGAICSGLARQGNGSSEPRGTIGAEPLGIKDFQSAELTEKLDSTIVLSSRAGKTTPVTYTMMGREALRGGSPLNSLPMTLNLQPSLIAVNEGGTGLGASKMTIRGSKGTQINVTLNGITLNDAESQEVFWVNIPAIANILGSVQIQRGLGTSANGAGAFGASINMSTASAGSEPYASCDVSAGSYNTLSAVVAAGTGLTRSGVYFDAAYSRGYTDGYIRNAKAKVQSAYAVLGWMKGVNSMKLTYLMGDQHTGITWNGIDLETYAVDRRYNSAEGDTDNYTQHHLQLNYTHQFPRNVIWSTTFNFTKGDGYYEILDGGLIERRMMDNYYLVLNSDVRYSAKKLGVTAGINLSRYNGLHFGGIVGLDGWYSNRGLKHEANMFARAEYRPLEWLTAYLDMQYRGVWLDMDGIGDEQDEDGSGIRLDYSRKWNFFNPRAGLTFHPGRHKAYLSAALGHREPARSDVKEIIPRLLKGETGADLKSEKMVDVEVGYEYSAPKVTVSANLYLMEYFDMLLETGRLSDVGYAIKENVGRGWRRGIEMAAAWNAMPWLNVAANATLSRNRIGNGGEYSTMLMSPSVVGMVQAAFTPLKNVAKNSLKTTTLTIDGKYVGKQYADNTSMESMAVPGYFVMNLSLTHEFSMKHGKLGLGAYVGNLLNRMYYADAVRAGDIMVVFPQAPMNFMFKAGYRF